MANVDAYEVPLVVQYDTVEPFLEQSAVLPFVASVVGAPSVFYIMQANDSVTGVRYDWKVPSTPDWAAAGYPGPNAATNVAIAGIKVG